MFATSVAIPSEPRVPISVGLFMYSTHRESMGISMKTRGLVWPGINHLAPEQQHGHQSADHRAHPTDEHIRSSAECNTATPSPAWQNRLGHAVDRVPLAKTRRERIGCSRFCVSAGCGVSFDDLLPPGLYADTGRSKTANLEPYRTALTSATQQTVTESRCTVDVPEIATTIPAEQVCQNAVAAEVVGRDERAKCADSTSGGFLRHWVRASARSRRRLARLAQNHVGPREETALLGQLTADRRAAASARLVPLRRGSQLAQV